MFVQMQGLPLFLGLTAMTFAPVRLHAQPTVATAPQGTGPFPAMMQEDPGLLGFTIYRPTDMGAAGKLPIVAWAEGGCLNVGNLYTEFNTELASHGYLVVAIGPIVPGVKTPTPSRPTASTPVAQAPTTPLPLPHDSQPEQLIRAIDWAVAQNRVSGGPYAGRIDTKNIAAMGHSCGGIQAAWAAVHDTRIRTLIFGNSGILDPAVSGISVTRAEVGALRIPILYLLGGVTDLAHPVGHTDFPLYAKAPVFLGDVDVGHEATYREPNGGEFAQITVAWLDWQLKYNKGAGAEFAGRKCGLCTDQRWTIIRRNMD